MNVPHLLTRGLLQNKEMPLLRAGFCKFRRSANARGERNLFIFWRIANLGRAGLVTNDGTHLDRISLKICRNRYVEREGYAALVNVDRLVGKFEFAVVPARVIYRADLNAAASDLDACRDRILTARAVRIDVQAVGDIDNDRGTRRPAAFDGAVADGAVNGLGLRFEQISGE